MEAVSVKLACVLLSAVASFAVFCVGVICSVIVHKAKESVSDIGANVMSSYPHAASETKPYRETIEQSIEIYRFAYNVKIVK